MVRRCPTLWCPRWFAIGFLLLVGKGVLSAAEPRKIDFQREILPVLAEHCFACHGPDAAERQGGLRLDDPEQAFAPTDSGQVVIARGNPDSSPLIERIETTNPSEVMPPPETHKPLSADQKSLLRTWIAQGAAYAPHWAFIPPRKHLPPRGAGVDAKNDLIDHFLDAAIIERGLTPTPPADRRSLLRRLTFDLTGLPPTREELDHFLRDRSPDAYEAVVDRLLLSPRFGEHFSRYWLDLVRYGDTHGLHLDNYREMWPYRDWVISAINNNLPYDQFIIEQLAGDLLPEATLEQRIASGFNRLNVTTSEGGSIYEEVFVRNVVDLTDSFGTIFLGMTVGCAVCHDHKFDPLTQRDYYSLFAFFNSLDGQALDGNAKDHPPVVRVPTAEHLEQLAEVARLRESLQKELQTPIPSVDTAQRAWQQSIIAPQVESPQWIDLRPELYTSSGGSTLEVLEDGSVLATGTLPERETVTLEMSLPRGTAFQSLRLNVLSDQPETGAGRSSNGNAVLSELEVATKSPGESDFAQVRLVYGHADFEQPDGPRFQVGYAIDGLLENDAGWAIGGHLKPGPRSAWFIAGNRFGSEAGDEIRLRVTLKYESQWAGHSFKRIRLAVADSLPTIPPDQQLNLGPWHAAGPFPIEHPAAGYYQSFASQDRAFREDEVFSYQGTNLHWRIAEHFHDAAVHPLSGIEDRPYVNLLHRRITAPTTQRVTLLLGTSDGYQVWLNGTKVGEFAKARHLRPLSDEISLDLKAGENDLYVKCISHGGPSSFSAAFRAPAVLLPESIRRLAAQPEESLSAEDQETLRGYYRNVISTDPDWLVLRDMQRGLLKREEEIEASMPTTLVWREVSPARPAKILIRGEYDKPGEDVSREVPKVFSAMRPEMARNRLGLAQWLVSPDHPLTARVVVNRIWQQIFGIGIVRTSEDFGVQGTPPTHPELLDTLAVEFREDGWNLKRLVKRMVMTEAYRRSSQSLSVQVDRDPLNQFLARGTRFRVDAEVIRDAGLFSSGLLVEKLGGPSVKPPQPDHLWRAVAYVGSNTGNFQADTGEKAYRRSLYTFWKRTSAPPQMTTFDAPSREACTARRERTNTPLQALMLMNEPQYLEAAHKLAERAEAAPDCADVEDQIEWMFETVTSRMPNASDADNLRRLYEDLRVLYSTDAELLAQTRTAMNPHRAALAIVASTILNLDAALNK